MRMLRTILAAWVVSVSALYAQSVEGHVFNSVTSAGVPNVTVYLVRGGDIAYSATSDLQGRFRLDSVKEGAYSWNYKAENFLSANTVRNADPLHVAGGSEPARLEIALIPSGKVSGRVLDASGTPVPNASVVLQVAWPGGALVHLLKTGQKGEYSRSEGLRPGTVLVAATAPSSWKPPSSRDGQELGWGQTFYPDVTDYALIPQITLAPGGELSNLDIKLAAVPVHRICGRVLDPRGNPVAKASVTLAGGIVGSSDLSQETGDDGSFEFASVVDSEWGLSSTLKRGGIKLWAGQRIQVKGRDLENVELRLSAPFSLAGKIVTDAPAGIPARPQLGVIVNYAERRDTNRVLPARALFPDFGIVPAFPDDQGGFVLENLYPGPYLIDVAWATPPFYLDSIRLGGREVLESDATILPGDQPLTVTYKMPGGVVRGAVEGCGGGAVLLIPQDPTLRRYDFIQEAACSPKDRFEIPAVRPGEYYALAVSPADQIDRYSVKIDQNLINQAVRISVRPNEATAADLHLIKR